MSDKLRAAAQAALNMLNDYHDCLQAANILRVGLSEPEQEPEPVACIGTNGELMWLKKPSTIYSKPRPLYTAPPRREWVGLTDADFEKEKFVDYNFLAGASFAEAKLKEKNT